MLKELELLFPEVNTLKNGDLKKAVLETFADAIKQGNWVLEDLKKIPATLLIPECPINFWQHTRAVTRGALAMAREMKGVYGEQLNIDFDIIIAGGLLHDVGKLLEIERALEGGYRKSEGGKRLRHPLSGIILAAARNIPEPVLHIIACHSKEGNAVRRTTEAVIIHHADFSNFEPFVP